VVPGRVAVLRSNPAFFIGDSKMFVFAVVVGLLALWLIFDD